MPKILPKFDGRKGSGCICPRTGAFLRSRRPAFGVLAGWDAAPVFLEVARSGSFPQDSRGLRMNLCILGSLTRYIWVNP